MCTPKPSTNPLEVLWLTIAVFAVTVWFTARLAYRYTTGAVLIYRRRPLPTWPLDALWTVERPVRSVVHRARVRAARRRAAGRVPVAAIASRPAASDTDITAIRDLIRTGV